MIVNDRIKNLEIKYHENKLSHAFLLVTNDLSQCNKDIKELIKRISCEKEYNDNCNICNICYQIDKGYLPNVVEINPDGQTIKKEQILKLKEIFSSKPLYIKNNIYIINQAEKMNSSSANTMLKFLEEPETNIIGFFITNNKENIIDTIKSRCQIIIANYEINNIYSKLGITEEEFDELKILTEEYFSSIKEKGLLINKILLIKQLDSREKVNKFFTYLFYLISESINKKSKNKDILDGIELEKKVEIQQIVYKILESINFNVNIELLLDKFTLELENIL